MPHLLPSVWAHLPSSGRADADALKLAKHGTDYDILAPFVGVDWCAGPRSKLLTQLC